MLSHVDSIARADIDLQLDHAFANLACVAEVSGSYPRESCIDAHPSVEVSKPIQPFAKRNPSVTRLILEEPPGLCFGHQNTSVA